MPLTAEFPGASFKNTVTGYRISARLTPRNGFQGNFYVYVCVRADPRTSPGAIKLGKEVPRGTLQITGGPKIEHTFKEIDLVGVETCATHAERRRVLEFQYDGRVSDVAAFKPTVQHGMQLTVAESRLGDDFTFNLGAKQENLLAFTSRQTPNGQSGFRFSSLANNIGNSWLAKVLALNGGWSDFTIPIGDLKIPVTEETVKSIYIDESYGDMLKFSLPSLASLTDDASGAEHVRFVPRVDNGAQLLKYQNGKYLTGEKVTFETPNDVVQTATFVFTFGTAGQHAIP